MAGVQGEDVEAAAPLPAAPPPAPPPASTPSPTRGQQEPVTALTPAWADPACSQVHCIRPWPEHLSFGVEAMLAPVLAKAVHGKGLLLWHGRALVRASAHLKYDNTFIRITHALLTLKRQSRLLPAWRQA